jgi:dihydrofolate reductase
MRRLIVNEWMSLDGVVQAPSYPDEDTDGGFVHGGWHTPYFDDISQQWVVDNLAQADAFLFGRRTYDAFAAHWPTASETERPLAEPLNTRPKFVISSTLVAPLPWKMSTLLQGGLPESIALLKKTGSGRLLVIGSAQLATALLAEDLVDELRLMIDPVMLGGGKRIFPDGNERRSFSLVDCQPTTTGAILATYARGHIAGR